MRVVAEDGVRARVDRRVGVGVLVVSDRRGLEVHAPVDRHDQHVDPRAQRGDVGDKRAEVGQQEG